jgi:predicted transcriptional regulator
MQYRSRTDIIAAMLRVANKGATKTRMMYGAYLSSAQLKEYVEFLVARNLIRRDEVTSLYWLTEQGMQFLRASAELDELSVVDGETAKREVEIVEMHQP